MNVSPEDLKALVRDKYEGNTEADMAADIQRLAAGEPLAYVIGWIPFLGLKIYLDSKPLIPRPETEWWTEKLIAHLEERFGTETEFDFLDLCAGSGAIGLAVLAHFPKAHVWFGELYPEHVEQIKRNIELNGLDTSRAFPLESNLFESMQSHFFSTPMPLWFHVIATNPPYIPESRELPESVAAYEPHGALYAGPDGLALITRIFAEGREHMRPDTELWMECDITNIEEAKRIGESHSWSVTIHEDQYGRPRYLVAH